MRVIAVIFLVVIILIGGLTAQIPGARSEDEFRQSRQTMVARQLQSRDITDPRVLIAMGKVPRHRFVPESLASQAYEDHPLPIGSKSRLSRSLTLWP
jgi:hypothetical protein